MGDLPSLPLFVDDYEAATAHLGLEEDGAYGRLMRLCWRQADCSIPADDAWIARHMRVDQETYDRIVRPILAEFFTRKRSRWFQKRLTSEHMRVRALTSARREAGRNGGNAKAAKSKDNAPSKAKDLPVAKAGNALALIPIPIPIEEREERVDKSTLVPSAEKRTTRARRFEEFWEAYPHRDGRKRNRATAAKKYAAHVKSGVPEETIISAVQCLMDDPRVRSGHARDPTTWLNQRGWEDEISGKINEPDDAEAKRAAEFDRWLAANTRPAGNC